MIDIAFSKLAIIGAAALVFIGPEKLPKVARILEKDELHERKDEDAVGLDAKDTDERGTETLLRRLPEWTTACLRSP